jgi:hypothetical protein
VERAGLEQHTVQIKLAEQLPEHRPLVVLIGGIAGLADSHSQGGRVQRHLGNERRAATRCGLDRTTQRFAITHKLIKIHCTTWDLAIVQSRIAAQSASTSTCRKK